MQGTAEGAVLSSASVTRLHTQPAEKARPRLQWLLTVTGRLAMSIHIGHVTSSRSALRRAASATDSPANCSARHAGCTHRSLVHMDLNS